MRPLLSIIIPTRNRYFYLKHLIKLIDSFKSEEIELIIQDNSDNNDEITAFLKENNFPNLKYFYTTKRLSMSENSDEAVLKSNGEYICFIGDDDGVCRNIIACTKWMKKNNIDALRSRRTSYIWGDSKTTTTNKSYESACVIYDLPKKRFKYLNPKQELIKILNKGFQTVDFIPLLYNGIVKREILNKIYAIGHTFFPGGSPDISNGVSLSFFVDKFVYVDFPIIISGTSQMTGGGIYKKKGKSTTLENVDFINATVIEQWEKDIPKIWAGRLAWPESGIKALRYTNQSEYIKYLNRNYMYAAFSIYYSQHFKIGYKYSPNKLLFYWYIFQLLTYNGMRVIKNKIESRIMVNKYVGRHIKRNIANIREAEAFLTGQNKFINFNQIGTQ